METETSSSSTAATNILRNVPSLTGASLLFDEVCTTIARLDVLEWVDEVFRLHIAKPFSPKILLSSILFAYHIAEIVPPANTAESIRQNNMIHMIASRLVRLVHTILERLSSNHIDASSDVQHQRLYHSSKEWGELSEIYLDYSSLLHEWKTMDRPRLVRDHLGTLVVYHMWAVSMSFDTDLEILICSMCNDVSTRVDRLCRSFTTPEESRVIDVTKQFVNSNSHPFSREFWLSTILEWHHFQRDSTLIPTPVVTITSTTSSSPPQDYQVSQVSNNSADIQQTSSPSSSLQPTTAPYTSQVFEHLGLDFQHRHEITKPEFWTEAIGLIQSMDPHTQLWLEFIRSQFITSKKEWKAFVPGLLFQMCNWKRVFDYDPPQAQCSS